MLQDLNYIGSALLVLAVLRQIRPARMTIRNVAWPLVVVAVILVGFLPDITFPSQGNSVLMIALGAFAGVLLGALCGITTRVFASAGGEPMAQAGLAAALFWLLGMAGRLAFVLYVDNGGSHAVGQWTLALHMNPSAWVPMLLFMALGEVLARTVVLSAKMYRTMGTGGRTVAVGS